MALDTELPPSGKVCVLDGDNVPIGVCLWCWMLRSEVRMGCMPSTLCSGLDRWLLVPVHVYTTDDVKGTSDNDL